MIFISELTCTTLILQVFHNVGICICVHELLEMGEGVVQHSVGSAYYRGMRLILYKVG
jgi:DNA-directed RNA polymerase III subunit RPC8